MKTLKEILELSIDFLTKHDCPNPRIEAEWLLGHALDLKRIEIYMQHDRPLEEKELEGIRELLRRRSKHEPVQYITGSTDFFGLELYCGPGVLIPRPETERLVELALKKGSSNNSVLDLCTGTGAIALALANEKADWQVKAVDISDDALEYTKKNLDSLKLENLEILKGDLFAPISDNEKFGLIVSNPPYVTENEYAELHSEVKAHEPALALVCEQEGLKLLKEIANQAPKYLLDGGHLMCEMGWQQGEAMKAIFEAAGFTEVEVIQDYTERDRIIYGKYSAN